MEVLPVISVGVKDGEFTMTVTDAHAVVLQVPE
jgi:hypothetical protein